MIGIPESDAFCEITHWLHSETKIIGGHQEAINFILKNAEHFSLQRTYILKYDLAYYSSYLKPVGEILANVVNKFTYKEPTIKIHSTTGQVYVKKNLIKNLAEQVYRPVMLQRNFTYIYTRDRNSAFPNTIECSPKRSVSISLRQHNYQAYKKMKTILSN